MADYLSEEQFSLLTADEQEEYLALLYAEEAAWTLTGRQLAADRLADQVDELLYGGAAGGGKSEWILHRAWKKSREIPNHRTLVLRTSFPELRRSIIQRSIVLYGQHTPPAERPSYRVSDKEWHFPNGSVIEFGYAATLEDTGQYLSAEYDMICFDELTQFSEDQYDLIRSRARTTVAKAKLGARPHVVGATNPGQRGHGWVKSTFVDPTERGDLSPIHIRRDGEDNWIRVEEDSGVDLDECRHVAFVPSTVLDNPHIDPNYIKHLKTLSEKNRRRYLEGDWDQLEGRYFDEFRRSITDKDGREIPYHVIPSFPIPQSWPKIRGIDWGFAAPYACVWIAFDEEGTAHVYRERYAKRMTPAEQAKDVLSATPQGEKVDRTFADPACWHQRDNLTIAQQWSAHGLRAVKGNNDRLAGWQRLRDYMKPDEDGNPGIRIHESCPNLIRTIPFMIHDEHKQEDLDTTLEDHLLDALRYALMSRPRKIIPDRIELVGMAKRMANSFKRKPKNRHEILGKQV